MSNIQKHKTDNSGIPGMAKIKMDSDGLMVKLHNRRVSIFQSEPEGVFLIFTRLGRKEANEPRIVKTYLTLTEEAAKATATLIVKLIGGAYESNSEER